MTEFKFTEIWNECVVPTATRLSGKTGFRFNLDSRTLIEKHYEKNRVRIRKVMRESVKKIDRHKVASALTYAIMREAPINISFAKKVDIRFVLVNELLALAVGLEVVSAFIRSNPETSPTQKEIFRTNRIHEGLRLKDGSSYVPYFCRSLARIRLSGIEPDTEHLMLLSHLYYFLERIHETTVLG